MWSRQLSASSPDGPEPTLVFMAALLTSSAVMSSYLIGWIFWASSGSKIIGSGAEAWECLILSLEMVSSFKGRFRHSYCRLEVSMFHSRFPSAFLPQTFWKSEPLFLILSLISNFFESSDSPEVITIGHMIAKVSSFVQVLSDGLLIYSLLRAFVGANWALS